MSKTLLAPNEGQFLFYDTEDGRTRVQVLLDGKTCWMPQSHIAELFETTPQNITQHINHISGEGELSESATCKSYLQVRSEGNRQVKRNIKIYNLEMIIAIGYRVRSARGTQFRRWATQTLSEFLVKGFVLDDERLKAAQTTFGQDYFDELLERIRDIRASERRFYQKITDIYATAGDYNKDAVITREFFATVQNKLEWAITGKTTAELIKARADANEPNMGLQIWKNSPAGKIRKGDVTVAKNYLSREELSSLNRIVTMYLDYAEDQARRGNVVTMARWANKLNGFLQFNDRAVLTDASRVQKKVAEPLLSNSSSNTRPNNDALKLRNQPAISITSSKTSRRSILRRARTKMNSTTFHSSSFTLHPSPEEAIKSSLKSLGVPVPSRRETM